jgi:hypothetical protein
MADGVWPYLHDLRRRAVCALAVFAAVLAIALAGAGLAQPTQVVHRDGAPSFDARGADAKALRPQQQLAHRGQSRSVRLGSAAGSRPLLFANRPAPRAVARIATEPAPHCAGPSGFLQQRTQCPREPPPPTA